MCRYSHTADVPKNIVFKMPLPSIEECDCKHAVGTFFPLKAMSKALIEELVRAGAHRIDVAVDDSRVYEIIAGMVEEICANRGIDCEALGAPPTPELWIKDDDLCDMGHAVFVAGDPNLFHETMDLRQNIGCNVPVAWVHVEGRIDTNILKGQVKNVAVATACPDTDCGATASDQLRILCRRVKMPHDMLRWYDIMSTMD